MNADQVLPQVVVGSYPEDTRDIDRLKRDFKITAVLNLHTDEDIDDLNIPWAAIQEHYRRSGVELRRVPVRDFDGEDLQAHLPECVRALGELIDDGQTVYCHCTAGMGRSPSVVVAYLHWVEQWDLDEAAGHVHQCSPCSPNIQAIRLARDDFTS